MALADKVKDLIPYIPDEEETQAAAEAADAEATRQEAARTRQEDLEKAEDLKQSIARQIEKGNPPQIPLCTDLEAIALLTRDPAWAESCRATLEAYAPGSVQQSLLEDASAKEIHAQQEQTEKYLKSTIDTLNKRLKATQKIQDGIMYTIARLGDLDDLITP